jgi:hypothetical protein
MAGVAGNFSFDIGTSKAKVKIITIYEGVNIPQSTS